MPFRISGIQQWLNEKMELDDQTVFVITPEEWDLVRITQVQVCPHSTNHRISQPVGGLLFHQAAYADNIDQQLANEVAARHQLIDATITLQDGTQVTVKYPKLDMGTIEQAFDGNNKTLIRTAEANPLVIKLIFSSPYPVKAVTVRVGGVPTSYDLQVLAEGETDPIVMQKKVPESNDYQDLTLELEHEVSVTELRFRSKIPTTKNQTTFISGK
jgi:hypothetical protein